MKHFTRLTGLAALAALAWPGPVAHAQTVPSWQQALLINQTPANLAEVAATALDANGNVYLAGSFLGTITIGNTTLSSTAGQDPDVFVAKWSPATNSFVWAQKAGGTGRDMATALAVNGSSVYVAGTFASTQASFGSFPLTNSTGVDDIFVAKLTDAGSSSSFGWATRAGGIGGDRATALAVSGADVYVAGAFDSPSAFFGTQTLNNAGSGSADAFVARLTDAGASASFTWATRAGGQLDDQATSLAVSGGSVYLSGFYRSITARFDNYTLINAATGGDIFVTRLAATDGAYTWVQRAGGTGHDVATALAVNGSSVYVAGYFSSPVADFGSLSLTNADASINAYADVFVTKLTDAGSTGSFVWAQRGGSRDTDIATALAVRGTDLYVSGYYAGSNTSFGATMLPNARANDVFVVRLTDDASMPGSFVWALAAGGTGGDAAKTLAVRGTSVYVAGVVTPPATFGALALTNPASSDGATFLAVLNDPVTLAAKSARALPGLALYPNPARGAATLQLPAGVGSATLTLLDALGRVVRSGSVTERQHELSLAGLAPGLYTLRVQAAGQVATRSLAVE
ncbi:T9SS type A sorting domain-containing protein [Hymenobacter persicinus]|uniref:T9SS type A sorting domain-containing protein n=1 Tax=Hymenobacter persicinus TaxID=2025506 RepID=A0A4Q5LER3_9BACT|nr:T9SS type A sorting domain-containing protein [Hymenobacter persicinus]RYU81001.1 T9SS type A sorting domain-containing protein [Hymenobacter persicinus]